MRARTLTVLTATFFTLAAAPAHAAWTAPRTLSSAHTFVQPSALGYSRGGAVASWTWQDGLANASTSGAALALVDLGGGAPAAQRALAPGTIAPPVAYGSDRVVVATQTGRIDDATLSVRFGSTSGAFGGAHRVARGGHVRGVQLAANRAGAAALGWWVDDGVANDRVYVSLRPGGGSFGAPILLGRGRVRQTSVAIGDDGSVLMAWEARGTILTRFKHAKDRAFHSVDVLRSQDTYYAQPQTAVDTGGGAWVAWSSQLLTEGGDAGEVFVQVARRPSGARRFKAAVLLERRPATARASRVSLAIGVGRIAVVGWSMWHAQGAQPSYGEIRAAQISSLAAPRTDTVARIADVEPVDGPAVASRDDPSGLNPGAAVLWTESVDPRAGTRRLRGALRLPTTATASAPLVGWGAPELVSAGPVASAPVAAYPGGGDALVALFANRTGGRNTATIQASVRSSR